MSNFSDETDIIIRPEPIIVSWTLLVLIGIIGNSAVVYITCRHAKKSATNIYIINLAVSDIAFLIIVVPLTGVGLIYMKEWKFLGEGGCKMFILTQYVTLHATCLTLMAMTIDRYQAIVYPIQSMNWRNTRASTYVCIGVWTVSIILSLPFAIYHSVQRQNDGSLICFPNWPNPDIEKGATLAVVLTSYVIPLTAIIVCYSQILLHLWRGTNGNYRQTPDANGSGPHRTAGQLRRIKRVTRMVAIVILLFAWCWLPIQFLTLWLKFDPNFPKTTPWLNFKIFAHTLSYANSCVNPFVYAFMNEGVRKAFQKKFPVISRFCLCKKKHKSENQEERSTMIDKAVMTARPGMESVSSMPTMNCTV